MDRRPRLAITLGDPCGIGPELLLRTLPILQGWADLTVVGARAGLELLDGPEQGAWTPGPADLWLDPTPDIQAGGLTLGRGSATSGRASVEAVRLAADLALRGEVDALVTLPLAKSAAHLAGYDIPGHTEFLQALSGAPLVRMAFLSPRLSVVLHTVHQSLRSVVDGLEAASVAETLTFAAERMAELTGNPALRVALCALNPHAGEDGAFGSEEGLLCEALAQADAAFRSGHPHATLPTPFPPDGRSASPRFSGPWPSDSLFHRAASGEFDLVVALYHDQGLIPIKLLEPVRAVNLTLGLPFIRTSPDHGTAFDKAGKGLGDPRNFLEAAALAIRLAGRARRQPWHPVALP